MDDPPMDVSFIAIPAMVKVESGLGSVLLLPLESKPASETSIPSVRLPSRPRSLPCVPLKPTWMVPPAGMRLPQSAP